MIPSQRTAEQGAGRVLHQDVLVGAPPLRRPGPGRARSTAVVATLTATAGACGAGWGLQQSSVPDTSPWVLRLEEVALDPPAPGPAPWGTLAAELPATSCAALVDWDRVATPNRGVEQSLSCADGSEVLARVRVVVEDGEQRLHVTLVADRQALRAQGST